MDILKTKEKSEQLLRIAENSNIFYITPYPISGKKTSIARVMLESDINDKKQIKNFFETLKLLNKYAEYFSDFYIETVNEKNKNNKIKSYNQIEESPYFDPDSKKLVLNAVNSDFTKEEIPYILFFLLTKEEEITNKKKIILNLIQFINDFAFYQDNLTEFNKIIELDNNILSIGLEINNPSKELDKYDIFNFLDLVDKYLIENGHKFSLGNENNYKEQDLKKLKRKVDSSIQGIEQKKLKSPIKLTINIPLNNGLDIKKYLSLIADDYNIKIKKDEELNNLVKLIGKYSEKVIFTSNNEEIKKEIHKLNEEEKRKQVINDVFSFS